MDRRQFLRVIGGASVGLVGAACGGQGQAGLPGRDGAPWFQTRAVMLGEGELRAMDWPAAAARLGLNILDLTYLAPSWLRATELGRRTVADCTRHGIGFEYGFHVCSWALPRDLFADNPELFRMNEDGQRTPDANLCVSAPRALEIAGERMASYVAPLKSTTGRYFFWIDDGQPMCRCPQCRGLSDSDQALVLVNSLLKAVRTVDPAARLCHLAYTRTLRPPTQVRPEPGIFLQFAPIERTFERPLSDRAARLVPGYPTHGELLDHLDGNLEWFGADGADVLEYWLDNSRFSGWKRENVRRVPWNREVFRDDLRTYAQRGIRHVRTYAFWYDRDYLARFGEPPVDEYAADLCRWRDVGGRPVSGV
ncbi:MAG: DUF4838 domain-containing protein [Armatimonadetes bacterium]|nr:DUF4838 domain-containing protein [Armatimonadota bacterium]